MAYLKERADSQLNMSARVSIERFGVFTATVEDGRLTYMTRFKDESARNKAWASFGADPEWAAVKAACKTDQPLLKKTRLVTRTLSTEQVSFHQLNRKTGFATRGP
jgi:hypothetical protein